MMQKFFKRLIPIISLSMLVGIGCRKQDEFFPGNPHHGAEKFDSYVAQSWYNLMLKLINETPGHTPPIVARSLGYTGVTLYEVLVDERPQHHSLVGQLNGLSSIPQRLYGNSYIAPITANAALARIIKDLFQNASAANMSRIDSLESANINLYAKHFNEKIIVRSRDYGRAVADAVFKWSLTDGGHEAYLRNFPSDYTPPVGVDKWIPAPPLYEPALLPYWGNNLPMVSTDAAGPVDPPSPLMFSTSPGSSFYKAAYEVYNTGVNLSPEEKTIALYWNRGATTFTPPGHNVAITLQMVRRNHLSLDEAAMLLAKVGIAVNDAGIVCWRAKYTWNLMRPVSFIRTYIDPSWMPLIGTPPFPSYTSGHSTFSAATAAILTAEIGDQISFTDSSSIAYGFSPRSFTSFNEYA